jgi:hypothetical protein
VRARTYASAGAFKAALDQRLRKVAEPGVGITRRRAGLRQRRPDARTRADERQCQVDAKGDTAKANKCVAERDSPHPTSAAPYAVADRSRWMWDRSDGSSRSTTFQT